MTSIYARVTRMQLDAFRSQGLAEADIAPFLQARLETQLRYDPTVDHHLMGRLAQAPGWQELRRQNVRQWFDPNLPYQCPFQRALLTHLWSKLFSKPQHVPPQDQRASPTPLLASAFTGSLNAYALDSADGEHAIVFEDALVEATGPLPGFLIAAFSEHRGDHVRFDFSGRTLPLERRQTAMDVIYEQALSLVATRAPYRQQVQDPIQTQTQAEMMQHAFEGMVSFLLGHEQAHLERRHHKVLRSSPTNAAIATEADLGPLKSTYDKHYKKKFGSFPQRDITRIALEFDADLGSFRMCFTYALEAWKRMGRTTGKNRERAKLEVLSWLCGVCLPLHFFALVEEVLAAAIYGADSLDDPLWDEHAGISDLLFRTTHPSPASRLDYAMTGLAGEIANSADDAAADLLSHFNTIIGGLTATINLTFDSWLDQRSWGGGKGAVDLRWLALANELPPAARERAARR